MADQVKHFNFKPNPFINLEKSRIKSGSNLLRFIEPRHDWIQITQFSALNDTQKIINYVLLQNFYCWSRYIKVVWTSNLKKISSHEM